MFDNIKNTLSLHRQKDKTEITNKIKESRMFGRTKKGLKVKRKIKDYEKIVFDRCSSA